MYLPAIINLSSVHNNELFFEQHGTICDTVEMYRLNIIISKQILSNVIQLYLQFTTSIIRLLTDGGTPLDAMHRYAPM
jgi:hypothetical protein